MMSRRHQSDSLMVTSKQQESAKKKSLNHISGSSWISAGLVCSKREVMRVLHEQGRLVNVADPEKKVLDNHTHKNINMDKTIIIK